MRLRRRSYTTRRDTIGAYLRSTCDPVTGPKVGPKSDAEAKALARMLRG
ncbi:MAG: hypothetical protein JWM75_1185 [Sphingomonas bacterium]|nr:hypothetical protein [Sphingomonas bacterium]